MSSGKRHKLQDLICWNYLEGRRCVKHAELASARGLQAVITPVPTNSSSSSNNNTSIKSVLHCSSTSEQSPSSAAPAVVTGDNCSTAAQAGPSDVLAYAKTLHRQLNSTIPCHVDADLSVRPGDKYHRWERVGAPLRLEVGRQEVDSGTVTVVVNPGLVPSVIAAASSTSTSSSGGSSSSCVINLLQQYAVGGSHVSHTDPTQPSITPAAVAAAAAPPPPPAAAAAATTPAIAVEVPATEVGLSQTQHRRASVAAAAAAAAAGNAVIATGTAALKLAGVPALACKDVCHTLLLAAAAAAAGSICSPIQDSSGSWPCLLPYGCCSKLHLWPNCNNNSSSSSRPCTAHIRHLVGLGKPCFCRSAVHVSWEDVKAEVTHQLTAVSAATPVNISPAAATPTPAAAAAAIAAGQLLRDFMDQRGSSRSCTVSSSNLEGLASPASQSAGTTVGVFVSGIPTHLPAAAVRQQLMREFEQFGVVTNVTVSAVGRMNRGWARVMMCDADSADRAISNLQGNLVLQRTSAPAQLSWCCGRADALFPDLQYDCRRQLLLDSVAAYSTTDSTTAAAMAALLAAVAALVKGWQHQGCTASSSSSSSSSSNSSSSSCSEAAPVSVADLTACAGGNVIAFMRRFKCVTAVELDPDRAEDLLHNIQVVMQHHQQQQQQQQHGVALGTARCSAAPTAAAAGAAFDPMVVQHLAVLNLPGDLEQQQQQQRNQVGVVCGDAVQLLPHMQQQDVVFLDPPWGGPGYKQQQQQQQQPGACAAHSSSGTITCDTCLSGVPLADFCSELLQRCHVLAVKLPSRWDGLEQFCRSVLHTVCFQQQQQGQQGQRELDRGQQGAGGSNQPLKARCFAVQARYGRSALVMFMTAPVGVAGEDGLRGQQQQQQQGSQLKQLRHCLGQHQQLSARILQPNDPH